LIHALIYDVIIIIIMVVVVVVMVMIIIIILIIIMSQCCGIKPYTQTEKLKQIGEI